MAYFRLTCHDLLFESKKANFRWFSLIIPGLLIEIQEKIYDFNSMCLGGTEPKWLGLWAMDLLARVYGSLWPYFWEKL